MTDCPTNEMAMQGIPAQQQPFTVILMMTDDMRADECCAADWVRRVWVYGQSTDAGIETMIEDARDQCADFFGWIDPDMDLTQEDIEQRKVALEPVAIYAGHIFDIYQP